MEQAISNTSPLFYLYRLGVIEWLQQLFENVWIPKAVAQELQQGRQRGYEAPNPDHYKWIVIKDPAYIPSEWFALDLGAGERAAMSLGLENTDRILIIDDLLARRTAQAAGLQVWGTLKIIIQAKKQGLTDQIAPLLERLIQSGIWISDDIRHRVLVLADEA